ncbi:hypothetical protein N9913_02220 [Porticoccaceae bacterium]|nr:hypothetical protein [Porticoccaceae bacterium]
MNELAIFVNTCDAFEDCWTPFFKLFRKYGGELTNCTIYLNTENKTFSYEGLNIVCLNVNGGRVDKLSWSECLEVGLSKIEEPYVLYLQEDYFMDQIAAIDDIKRALSFMKSNEGDAVYLNRYGPIFDGSEGEESIVRVPVNSKYLLSTQACIWNKKYLKSIILPWENGWMFEKFGGLRVRKNGAYGIFSFSKKYLRDQNPVLDYVYTGIMKGRWHAGCVALFSSENIDVDFSARGFYKPGGVLKSKLEVVRKLFSSPFNALKSLIRSV